MQIVVIGGSGLIGSKLVTKLRERGHQTLAVSPASGVNTVTGEGLAAALEGASVVVDVSNSPSFDEAAVLEFFETSTRNLLDAESAAGAGHHVALSVVGADRLPDSGYLRAKLAQEKLIEDSRSLLGRPRDPVFRVRRPDRRRSHQRHHGAPGLCAHPAHGGRRCGQGARGRHRRPASERCHRDRRAPAIPPRRTRTKHTARAPRPPRGHHRPARALLRRRTARTQPCPAAGARLAKTRVDDWLNQSTISNG